MRRKSLREAVATHDSACSAPARVRVRADTVVLFAIQGEKITAEPADVARITLPLPSYFLIMWIAGVTIAS